MKQVIQTKPAPVGKETTSQVSQVLNGLIKAIQNLALISQCILFIYHMQDENLKVFYSYIKTTINVKYKINNVNKTLQPIFFCAIKILSKCLQLLFEKM